MNKLFVLASVLLALITATSCSQQETTNHIEQPKTQLEVKDGWFYINGVKTFINALGYEISARPGQHPYENREYSPERVSSDLKVIKQAGFNAVRTWAELSEEELQEVQKSGLKIILGIAVNPKDDFSDPEIVAKNLASVRRVLSYSKNYDCVIGYLVMNEPMPLHIKKVGAQATVDLWTQMRDIIHQEHPGIPVTISGNSAITEFVNMNLFDVYAYNAYDYDGFNYSHGYTNAAKILPEMNGQGKPLFITEFGYSVSRDEGEDRYGGNTLIEQMTMLPWYYRQLLDAGASGASPFYYADGWWKGPPGTSPADHDDTPEEWFGFWGYQDGQDTVGYPRPVWHALTQYNKAIISSPKNQTFYKNEVPIDIFLQPDVNSMRVIYKDRVIYSKDNIAESHLADTISFAGQGLTDRELIFEFYDKNSALLKLEGIVILTDENDIEWPTVTFTSEMTDLNDSPTITTQLALTNNDIFTLSDEVRYLYAVHIGWSRGEQKRWAIDPNIATQTLTDTYEIPEQSPVLGLYVGTEIRYGKFVKTIHDEQLIYRGDWADPIRVK